MKVMNNGRHGVSFLNNALELFILLLADDIALLSETVVGLQNQLNNLYQSSLDLGLRVNMKKTNVVVFRIGGYLGARESWLLGDEAVPVINSYKYIGINNIIIHYIYMRLISMSSKRLHY